MSEKTLREVDSHYSGHRKRLREKVINLGPENLGDYEVLEMALFAAHPRGDTKPLAKALLKRFGTLNRIMHANRRDLSEVPGMGEASIAVLKTILEISRRLAREEIMEGGTILSSWDKILTYCRLMLAHEEVENFHLLFLDRKNRLIADERQQKGTVDQAPIYAREVVKRALEIGASAIILVHNHPSGDPTPSKADITVTRDLQDIAEKLGIHVHDHVIVGKGRTVSLKSMGLM